MLLTGGRLFSRRLWNSGRKNAGLSTDELGSLFSIAPSLIAMTRRDRGPCRPVRERPGGASGSAAGGVFADSGADRTDMGGNINRGACQNLYTVTAREF